MYLTVKTGRTRENNGLIHLGNLLKYIRKHQTTIQITGRMTGWMTGRMTKRMTGRMTGWTNKPILRRDENRLKKETKCFFHEIWAIV